MVLSTYFNRVLFLAAAGGTADFIVGGAVTGYSTPAQRSIPNGTVVSYTAETVNKAQWETGQGTYSANTVLRQTVRESSSSNTKVNFASAPNVWLDYQTQDIFTASVSWVNVKNFGATGNGVTDDTAAINSAIASFNTATTGVLYFPAGAYLVSGSLTTITGRGQVLGDGMAGNVVAASGTSATEIVFTASSVPLFTTASWALQFCKIAMNCTAGTPAAGCTAILVTAVAGSTGAEKIDILDCSFQTFYDVVEYRTGQFWLMNNCSFLNWSHWGMRITNLITPDGGGWQLTNNVFASSTSFSPAPAAAIHIEAGGGDHIVNTNIVTGGGSVRLVNGIEVIPNGINTVDLLITNCSIENMTGFGISLDMTLGSWGNIMVNNCEFALGPGGGAIYCKPLGVNGFVFSNLTMPLNAITIVPNGSNPLGVTVTGGSGSVAPESSSYPGGYFWQDGTGGVGGGQYFTFASAGTLSHLVWNSPPGNSASLTCRASDTSRSARMRATNNPTGNFVELFEDTATSATGGYVQADTKLVVASDCLGTSGGSDPISFRAGGNGTAAEVFQAIPTGLLKMTNAANFTANGGTAASFGSTSPGHATPQKWLTIQDSGGSTFYIPCF